ncbi:unnamed protein product [Acanthocheilonema viteae]|uniref:NR LBD domain-containing protein n=1 Tax=Acanthocheilonema viteae TaxID=6277 RepID=A0A498SF34_ACAVI|nr:unnamed protein product [Acanthocheilonema viteae]
MSYALFVAINQLEHITECFHVMDAGAFSGERFSKIKNSHVVSTKHAQSTKIFDALVDIVVPKFEHDSIGPIKRRREPLLLRTGENSETGNDFSETQCCNSRLISYLFQVDWAKGLEPFFDLIMDNKVILLKDYAPQHLILVPAFCSPDTTRTYLSNNTGRNHEEGIEFDGLSAFKTSNIMPRVMDEIVWPMRHLQMREEFVCLKALAFLHPEAKGLSPPTQTALRDARNRILKALYCYILAQMPEEAPIRYGNILLLVSTLKALAQFILDSSTDEARARPLLRQRLTSVPPANIFTDIDAQQHLMTVL